MIKVKFNKSRSNKDDLTVVISNETTKAFADLLSKELKGVKCEKHPNTTSTISITTTPLKQNMFKIKKESFCCPDFKDSIDLPKQ